MAVGGPPEVGAVGDRSPGLPGRTWRALKGAAREGRALLVAAVVSVVVSLITLLQTYDGFFREALGTGEAWALIGVNALFTVLLVLAFTAIVKPQRTIVYATIVAASFQVLIATDLEVQPLAGSSEVGATSKLNLGTFYNPVEEWLGSAIEDPVEDAKRSEIAGLRRAYPRDTDLPRLREQLDDVLATETSVDASERADLMKEVDGVVAKRSLSAATRVREVALLAYASAGRDVVQDLAAGPAQDGDRS